MNINEKRKLEALVSSKLSVARDIYKHRRETEYEGLRRDMQDTLPEKVQAIVTEGEKLQTSFLAQYEVLKAKARVQGFHLTIRMDEDDDGVHATLERTGRWVNGNYEHTYTEPTLVIHEQETNTALSTLDDLGSRYSVEIWSETADMKNTFDKFQKELSKLAI